MTTPGKAGEQMKEQLYLEAEVAPSGAPTGREWEVTIIGAQSPEQLVTIDGREYVRSANGRLYAVDALEASTQMWEGVKVFDDHLTQEEFEARQGMRSPKNEWLGSLVKPRFVRENGLPQLRAIFKVVEDGLIRKLKNAWDAGVLHTIGLSIDTFPAFGSEVLVEGQLTPVIEGFRKILSVDLVGNPAAGGAFERLIAAAINDEENDMSEEREEFTREDLEQYIADQVAAALQAQAAEADVDEDIEEMSDDEVQDALDDKELSEKQIEAKKAEKAAKQARRQADLARTELAITRALERAKLPEKFERVIWAQFDGRVATQDEIKKAIGAVKEAHASLDPTGRVRAGEAHDIEVGLSSDDRFALEFQRIVMGNRDFRALETHEDEHVKERVKEMQAYKAWINSGKPELARYPKMSALLYDYFGGDPFLNARAAEAATTSSLATVVKNTVNIMTANDYSMREEWWAPIVRTEEVDTIDDATLARVYGVDSLDTVNEGAAYTELILEDEEETASFVKRGNYIGITLETLMRDKLQYVRRIPGVLADAWYNTQSDLVSGVFTVNSNAGPVLADTGALFNATAVGTGGGHANLLTTALSHSQFGTVRTAMMKQTDQPLGDGRKLLIEPRYLLVPVDLETTALEIRNAELVPGADFDAAGGGAQTPNLYRGRFEVIVVPTWTDATDWAAVGDPQRFPAIWLIYPRGQRTPQVFSAENETSGAMFTNDELRFKVRLMTYRYSSTYDCAPVSDFRPLHKSNV